MANTPYLSILTWGSFARQESYLLVALFETPIAQVDNGRRENIIPLGAYIFTKLVSILTQIKHKSGIIYNGER
jgi:hypothetical protein